MNVSDRTFVTLIQNASTQLRTKLPKTVVDAFAKAKKLEAGIGSLGSTVSLADVVALAILAGREPASDPDVQRAVTAQTLESHHGLPAALGAVGMETVNAACSAELDKIVAGWRKAFDAAVLDLVAAHKRIGDRSLDDTASIMALGDDVADVWASATKAVQTIDTVLGAWTALMQLTRAVPINSDHRPFRLAALTLEQKRNLPAKLSPWDAVLNGLTLSLPDPAEYRARIDRVQSEGTQQEANAAQAALDSLKPLAGTSPQQRAAMGARWAR